MGVLDIVMMCNCLDHFHQRVDVAIVRFKESVSSRAIHYGF